MSRNIATVVIATLVAVSFLFVGVGAVAAHDGGNDTAGASGNCSDSAGNGGGGSVGYDSENGVDATGPDEVASTAEGLAWFAEQRQDSEDDPCDNHEEEDSYDYLEAHAGDFQYCYSQDNSAENGGVATDGSDACGH